MLNLNQLDALWHLSRSANAYGAALLGYQADKTNREQAVVMFDARTELFDAIVRAGNSGTADEQISTILREAAVESIARQASRLTERGRDLHSTGAYERAIAGVTNTNDPLGMPL